MSVPARVLGVGGWDRSGSTIIGNIIGSFPGVVTVGELNNLWKRGLVDNRDCGCGRPFDRCPLWSPVMDRGFGDAAGASLLVSLVEEVLPRMGNARVVGRLALGQPNRWNDLYAKALARLHGALSEVSGAALIVDTAKMPWHLALTSRLGLDFSLLHLVRDPRGVVHSHRKQLLYDRDESRPMSMNRFGTTFTSLGWRYRNFLLSHIVPRDRYMSLRYEDFVADGPGWSERIAEFAGVTNEQSPWISNHEVVLSTSHSVSGNPVRFENGRTVVALDREWQESLPLGHERLVRALTWPSMERHGYH